MATLFEHALAHAEATGSRIVHEHPESRIIKAIAGSLMRVEDDADHRVLRWRIGDTYDNNPANVVTLPRHPSASSRNLSTWRLDIIAAERERMENILVDGRLPALGYYIGDIAMVGTRELNTDQWLRPVDSEGNPDDCGELLAAVVRTGANANRTMLGAAVDGHMITLPTLAIVRESIPQGLLGV